MKTPRTVRGLVRKQSKVSIGLPVHNLNPPSTPEKRTKSRSPGAESRRGEDSPSPSKKSSTMKKSVSFAEDLLAGKSMASAAEVEAAVLSLPGKSGRSEADLREVGRIKSQLLMGSLYDLRRAGRDSTSPQASARGSSPEVEAVTEEQKEAETLMNSTLRDLEDTEVMLRRTEAMLAGAHEPVQQLGGSRHATAVVSARTLAVVSRKAYLVHNSETRLAAFQSAHDRKDDLLKEVIAGAELDANLKGVKEFLQTFTHRDGDPADSDKSSFKVFAQSFGLPAKHQTLAKLRHLMNDAADWWASAALREALAGASAECIRRLMDCVALISGNPNHPALAKVSGVLGDCLAKKVLEAAKRYWAKDETTCARSAAPQPESARQAGDAILDEIKGAVAMGAPPKHPCLSEAKQMETALRSMEKDRWAMKALNYAEDLQAKDEAEAAKATGVPPVGPASDAADMIEKEVQKTCAQHGIEDKHELIAETMSICKALRDKDGERKRLANREKRLAEQQAEQQAQQG